MGSNHGANNVGVIKCVMVAGGLSFVEVFFGGIFLCNEDHEKWIRRQVKNSN